MSYGDRIKIDFGEQTLELDYSTKVKIHAQWEESHCGCCSNETSYSKYYTVKELHDAMKNIEEQFKHQESIKITEFTKMIKELQQTIGEKQKTIDGLKLALQEFKK